MQKHISQLDHRTKSLLCLMKGKYKKFVHSEQKINSFYDQLVLDLSVHMYITTGLQSSDSTVPYTICYCWYSVTTANG